MNPRVLFLTTGDPDYLSDSLFHGLRQVLGSQVVEWPRSDPMYRDYPDEFASRLYGRGFTLYRRLAPITLDRTSLVARMAEGAFHLVIFGSIQRQYGLWLQLRTHLLPNDTIHVAFLDGEDWHTIYPYILENELRPRWRWALPRAHKRYPYFKRELMSIWAAQRANSLPAVLARRLPIENIHPIAFSIPEDNLVDTVPEKRKEFPRHIVDREVAGRVTAAQSTYAFEHESDYYADLRESRFGITTKRSGWDCLRHYEIAASGTPICFRDLGRKPAACAPHGLDDGNTITYSSYDELAEKLRRISIGQERELAELALGWARANTTRRRAEEFLDAVGFDNA